MPTKKIEEAEEVTRCPECNSGHLSFDYERGELICEECGLVLTDQMIDQGPEWRRSTWSRARSVPGQAPR